ncbi:hypothetical protein E2C01_053136 [Portunus trituberculatus]|uniref:Uncharacterized protein n=1 Tax=Portunus trituberculatus TaxID=210409 RepID=A0A5B7GGA3_PORTR|nr:hypothetical protein [Portunus trituberculatus]
MGPKPEKPDVEPAPPCWRSTGEGRARPDKPLTWPTLGDGSALAGAWESILPSRLSAFNLAISPRSSVIASTKIDQGVGAEVESSPAREGERGECGEAAVPAIIADDTAPWPLLVDGLSTDSVRSPLLLWRRLECFPLCSSPTK